MKTKIFIVILAMLMIATVMSVVLWKSLLRDPSSRSDAPTNLAMIEVSGKITGIYQNPETILILASTGDRFALLISSSTQVMRDVGGTVGGTFNFNSLRIGDLVAAKGSTNGDHAIISSLVEQVNSQGID